MAEPALIYLGGYGPDVLARVRELLDAGQLGAILSERYPAGHDIQSERALYDYANTIKREYMRSAPPLSKVRWSDDIGRVHHALGLHTQAARVQGSRLGSKHELRVASLFKRGPLAFLEAVVVHELAHLREREHDKAFYRLCQHMLPDYHQVEFDMRLWLTWQDTLRTSP